MTRSIGVAHLSALGLEPHELIHAASEAGFDFVGLRVLPATPTEVMAPVHPGSAALVAAERALAETGLRVLDVEFLPLTAQTRRETWMPALEAGAVLGARAFTVTGADADEARLTDTLAALAADAREVGIRPLLEPISYNAVSRVADAARIAAAAGAGVMIDALHMARGDNPLADIAALDPDLLPVVQLCDGPAEPDAALRVDAPLPRGMSAQGSPRMLEARAVRSAPGEGAFDLHALLDALPADIPLSLEAPNAFAHARLGAAGWLTHLRETTERLLAAREVAA